MFSPDTSEASAILVKNFASVLCFPCFRSGLLSICGVGETVFGSDFNSSNAEFHASQNFEFLVISLTFKR